MKKHIVCFGDSNTHGYCADPDDCADGILQRFNENERWTCRLRQQLGAEYLVFEEGLSGRTTVFSDPLHEGLCGIDYLVPCLKSHEPVSLLVIMLGTNDTKERFSASATCISMGLERLIQKAQCTNCWGGKSPNILVVCPPPIDEKVENSPVSGTMGKGCALKSEALAPLYEQTAKRLGCHFLDAEGCSFNTVDYMHLTKLGHCQLAERLAQTVVTLM